jgi:RNA polymerase sigma factor (sigma-70 family)
MTENQQLLADYARTGSDAAFRDLVGRYVDLVHSTALRLVEGDSHRAEDVTQVVFSDLARLARTLSGEVMLGGWLHRHTCFTAAKIMRGERRRQSREKLAVEMNTLQNHSGADFALVAPILDEVINQLDDADRTAILLRFFEQHDFRTIGQALGGSEDAARMRVTRALEKLQTLLKRQGVTASAATLAVALSVHAVHAAPAGLAVTIATSALLGGNTIAATTTAATLKTIAMTTLQKTLITSVITVAVGSGIYEAHRAAALQTQVRTLRQQQDQLQQLQRERDQANQQLAALRDENDRLNRNTDELLKLRGEVALLQRHPSVPADTAGSPDVPAETPVNSGPSPEDLGREAGLAVVRGDPGAMQKVRDLARAENESFKTNSPGLNDTQRGELSRQTFAPINAAFSVIAEAAAKGNQSALDAVMQSVALPELQGEAVQSLGVIAGSGNNDALDVLLNYQKYGLLLSATVGALKPAAESGNPQAVDFLAAIAQDPGQSGLWYLAADGLTKAAAAGNVPAIDALITLSGASTGGLKNAALSGLRQAAANQNVQAANALHAMGLGW